MLLLDGLMFTHVVALSNVFPIYVIEIKDTKNLWEILLVEYRKYVTFYITNDINNIAYKFKIYKMYRRSYSLLMRRKNLH